MDHRVTQCPRCGTSFRVTEAHLAVAAGAVRCGSCLHIFNARDHWAAETPPAPAAAEKPLAAKRVEEIEIDDDALFDDDSPLFDDEPPAKTSGGSIFNPADDDFTIVDDDGSDDKLSENFLELNSWEEDSGHSFHDARQTDDAAQGDEERWAEKLLEDDERDEIVVAAPKRSAIFEDYGDVLGGVPEVPDDDERGSEEAATEPNVAEEPELAAEFLDLGNEDAIPARTAAPAQTSDGGEEILLESLHAERPVDERPLFGLHGLEQEPLQLHQFVHEPRWPKVLWGIGLVVALAFALGQYIYFNFTELSRSELRPWLARACAVAGCVLPPQSDISQIRTSSLIVRSHPSQRGALAVDAIITNQADFPQTYPPLQLQFTDLNGAPVAGRQFLPEEYLSGELAGAKLMPVQQPVHIALELVDPGPRAVNYQLTVANGEENARRP